MDRGAILAVAIAVAVIAGAGTAGVAMAFTDDASPAQTDSLDQAPSNSTITVSASSSESTEPDKAVLRIAVQKTAEDPNTARIDVAENVSAVTEALIDMNIAEKDIRTTDYRISERTRPPHPSDEEPKEEPVYYARQTIEVHLTNTDTVGSVIDTAVEAGATDVQDVRFTLTEETRNELRNDALESAMDQARSQADTLANQSEMSITGPIEITTQSHRSPVLRYSAESAAATAGGTEIDAGPVSVDTRLTVTYQAVA